MKIWDSVYICSLFIKLTATYHIRLVYFIQDGVGHPGMDMSDSVDGLYEEGHYDEEEEDEEDGQH